MESLEIETLEITRENISEKLKEIYTEIEDLWKISDKDWKKLPNEEKQEYYKKDKELQTQASNMIIEVFKDFKNFNISEFGNLISEKLDISISICKENIEIERGVFNSQEYAYKLIEFKEKDFEKNLIKFCETNIRWYSNNNGVPN